jgi:osmotically-inducible protein OsmY
MARRSLEIATGEISMRRNGLVLMLVLGSALGIATGNSAATLDDAVLNVKVRTALLEKLGTDALGIAIDVNGPSVVLSGSVDKSETKTGARPAAAAVKGVGSVQDRITLGHGPATRTHEATAEAQRNFENALLEARVKGRLFEQVGENAFKIGVRARSGVVTLEGAVPTAAVHSTALETAKGTKGVVRVADGIGAPK